MYVYIMRCKLYYDIQYKMYLGNISLPGAAVDEDDSIQKQVVPDEVFGKLAEQVYQDEEDIVS